jgi:outer membrane protein OmpA-like peptidoglycan-associated protein/tetratricopeptide (TPR) repeat protein
MKKIFLFLLTTIFLISALNAQVLRGIPSDEKKKEADEQLASTNYDQAIKWANEYQKDLPQSQDAIAIIGVSELNMRDYAKAEIALGALLTNDKKDQKFQEYRYEYARALKFQGKYKEAADQFTSYAKYGKDDYKRKMTAIELKGIEMAQTAQADGIAKVKNAGKNVNAAQSEFGAAYVGEDMYYSSLASNAKIILGPDGKPKETSQEQYAKLYKSSKSGAEWGKGTALNDGVNLIGVNNVHTAFSEDGKTLYFSRCQLNGNKSICNVYISTLNDGKWSPATKIEGGVNGEGFSSKQPAVGTINGREAIFFASDMTGGTGGFDIYYAVRQDGAKFSTPVNVGPSVNTFADDQTPFYKADVLYFSSEGHPGFGGFDIFEAEQDGVTWSNVANLGKDINSSVDEMYYTLDATGYVGSFVSNRTSENSLKAPTCCDDIYLINYPIPVIIDLEVLAFDSNGGELKGVTVQLVESGAADTKSNDRSNFFNWQGLKKDTEYKLIASKNGYTSVEQTFSTSSVSQTVVLKERLALKEILVANVAIKVVDNFGQALNKATVTLTKNGGTADAKTGTTTNIFSWENIEKGATYTAKATYSNEVGPYEGNPVDFVTFTVPNENTTVEKTIQLLAPVKVDPNVPIVLPSINFDLGKWAIRPDAQPQLDKLVRLMTDFPAITKVELSAHTDVRGSASANLLLSQRRAQSAVDYLISKGVSPSRIQSAGYGETRVKNECLEGVTCSDAQHEVNRRVEFAILEGPSSVPASYFK